MNQVVQLEQTMKTFLRDFQNAFNLVQNPPQDLDMNYVESQARFLSQLAQEMQTDIYNLKQIDTYTEEEIEQKTQKLQQERKIALQQYLDTKNEADKLNENLKANIDTLANKLYNLNE
ncbi:hypothetical protein ABPG72_008649 [Tetrahymena utriculariae]